MFHVKHFWNDSNLSATQFVGLWAGLTPPPTTPTAGETGQRKRNLAILDLMPRTRYGLLSKELLTFGSLPTF